MRRQEMELHRLHDLQKSRADDLERVTAALTRSLSSGFIAADGSVEWARDARGALVSRAVADAMYKVDAALLMASIACGPAGH